LKGQEICSKVAAGYRNIQQRQVMISEARLYKGRERVQRKLSYEDSGEMTIQKEE
jgi:hypothetical protein